MVVVILEKVPATLRGELSRWMIEPRTGVFVGMVSALVRDKLWERVCERLADRDEGAALMLHTARTEQGFKIQTFGDPSRTPVDFEGLTLIRVPGLHPKRRRRILKDLRERVPAKPVEAPAPAPPQEPEDPFENE